MGTVEIPVNNRDMYASVMFTQLFKEGHYATEFMLFGFAFWQHSAIEFFISTDEEETYNAFAQAMLQGKVGTPVLSLLRRLKVKESEQKEAIAEMIAELKGRLAEVFPPQYFEFLARFAAEPDQNTAFTLLEHYRSSLREAYPERQKAFAGLVRMAKIGKMLDAPHCQALLKEVEQWQKVSRHTFSGFAYYKDDVWQYYADAYRPKAIVKKMRLLESNLPSSPILELDREVMQKTGMQTRMNKTGFLVCMKEIFDKDYFEILHELQTLPPTINVRTFMELREAVIPTLPPEAVSVIKKFESLWHIG